MSKSFRKDLTGQRFGRLTVLEFVPNNKPKISYWKCRCDCGNITTVKMSDLRSGHTKSCGCYGRKKGMANPNFRHGGCGTRLYNIWCGMKARCYNVNDPSYKDYGGRGIKMDKSWENDFSIFATWAQENGYNNSLTIDRIDNDGNYEPSNCRWTDMKAQGINKRNNIIVKFQGEKMCLSESAKCSGIPYQALKDRYRSGDRGERLFRKVRKLKK